MSKTSKSTSSNSLMQFIVPAAVGAAVSAAAFAAFIMLKPEPVMFGPEPAPNPVSTAAPSNQSTIFNDGQKMAIEQTVRDYLLKNPQILMQMSDLLDKQQTEEQNLKIKTAISENADTIFRDKYGLGAGNPDGDVTVVEFSDYNCPYCKRAYSDIEKLLKADTNIRFVMKEFPIFGERSASAARVAIAAQKQGKYMELHSAMMKNRGANNEKQALKLAEKLGFDMDKLREDMKSDDGRNIIEETRVLGNKLGIQGTPFFLIGDRTIPGAPDALFDELMQKVADVRKNGCETKC